MYRMLRKAGTVLLYVLPLIALMALFSGCAADKKTVIMAYPNYFELNKGISVPIAMGQENIAQTIPNDMYCYDAQAQADVLSAKKGSK